MEIGIHKLREISFGKKIKDDLLIKESFGTKKGKVQLLKTSSQKLKDAKRTRF